MSKLNLSIRLGIEKGLEEKKTYREIAKEVGISKSTIGYEVKHYSRKDNKYNAEYADWQSQQISNGRNANRSKFRNKELLKEIDKLIRSKRAPKDISFFLKDKYSNQKEFHISHETIYQITYSFQKIQGHQW